ncbi:MAG: hypothetical protein CTY31_03880 [Hyphomicrobium sp.]|nr:MAG: hypothetical protein CTY39_00795 [Hyphomicrobium sp.]PPD01875.1 MAG: hypothetical protein CTY31_03880 [Hyphomicrobium sp.]
MHYERLSRALATISCLSTFSLAATSMAFAAVNVGKLRPQTSVCELECQAAISAPPIAIMSAASATAVVARWSSKI